MTATIAPHEPIGLGIVGLGGAGAMMLRAAASHPGFVLRGAADPLPAPRAAFAQDFGLPTHADIDALLAEPGIEAVYVASPHQHHAAQAIRAAERGKHVLVEKPLALGLADCDAVIEAVERHGVRLIAGHTHAFDPNIRTMRRLIVEGAIGNLAMIATLNYTDFLYRPRRQEELDTAQGGGVVFNQLPHQIDVIRLIGGGMLASVRAQLFRLDPARPTEGGGLAFLAFADGAAASLVYSGHDFFDSDELHFWVSESGLPKRAAHGSARRALAAARAPEAQLRAARGYRAGVAEHAPPPHLPHFGVTIVTGSKGELRASADGVLLYSQTGVREIAVERGIGRPGHGDALDALWRALREGETPLQDARWGKATLEAALAILRSAQEGREIALAHQVPVPRGF